jgi:hypothetical protein
MRTLTIALALTACGVVTTEPDAGLPDAGAECVAPPVLPETCGSDADCPAGYGCDVDRPGQRLLSAMSRKCLPLCRDRFETGPTATCVVPYVGCDGPSHPWEPSSDRDFECGDGLRLTVTRLCGSSGIVTPYGPGAVSLAGSVIDFRPWQSTDSPCEAWRTMQDRWPFRF